MQQSHKTSAVVLKLVHMPCAWDMHVRTCVQHVLVILSVSPHCD